MAQVLGLSPAEAIEDLLGAVQAGKPKSVLGKLAFIRDSGSNDAVLIKQLTAYLRGGLTGKHDIGMNNLKIVKLSERLLRINDYADTGLALELALVESSLDFEEKSTDPPLPPAPIKKPTPAVKEKPFEDENQLEKSFAEEPQDTDLWQAVLTKLKTAHSTLYGIARMAEPKYDGDKLELHFKFPFHYKQMNIDRNRLLVEQAVKEADKNTSGVILRLVSGDGISTVTKDEPLKNISNIFGSAEVIES